MPKEKTHKVRINRTRTVNGNPLVVRHPETKSAFPVTDFDMTNRDFSNPRIRRLFARGGEHGGVAGGVMGDLHLVTATKSESAKSTNNKT